MKAGIWVTEDIPSDDFAVVRIGRCQAVVLYQLLCFPALPLSWHIEIEAPPKSAKQYGYHEKAE